MGGRSAISTSSRVSNAFATDGIRRVDAATGRAGSVFWIEEVIVAKEFGVNALMLDMRRKMKILDSMIVLLVVYCIGSRCVVLASL